MNTIIPYTVNSKKAILPKIYQRYNEKFVYNLFSPINGVEIPRGENYLDLGLEIVIPKEVECFIKWVHTEENGAFIHDLSMDKGLIQVSSGKEISLHVKLPKGFCSLDLKRYELVGYLLFNRFVTFKNYGQTKNLDHLVKYNKLSTNAFKPFKEKGNAGYDLCSAYYYCVPPKQKIKIYTDLALELPRGTYGRIASRSGLSDQHSIDVLGGVIDRNFRGNIFIILINHGEREFRVKIGDRVAQIIIEKCADCLLVEADLSKTLRGPSCLGSTGLSGLEPISESTNSSVQLQTNSNIDMELNNAIINIFTD